MDKSRRDFLKAAGLGAAGLAASAAMLPTAGAQEVAPNPKAFAGRRWAMVVDINKCPGDCSDKCIAACHQAHNVPAIGTVKEEVKWLWQERFQNAFPDEHNLYVPEKIREKPVLVLCNHCANPACVRVCPTQATFKREDGIVMMDMHRCIGCRFCMAACPYGSRSFNFRDPRPYIKKLNPDFPSRDRGVVEKCNFCAERLAVGKVPACVEACQEGALLFGDLGDPASPVSKILRVKFHIRRKPSLGTEPSVYYVI